MTRIRKQNNFAKVSFLFFGLFFVLYPLSSGAQYYPSYSYAGAGTGCSFERDLQYGAVGEDVRCLQQYLNSSGYQIASYGAGSPGNETTYYGSLTSSAVSRWQSAQGLYPANGVFGVLSRAKYNSMSSVGTYTAVPAQYPYTNYPYSLTAYPSYSPTYYQSTYPYYYQPTYTYGTPTGSTLTVTPGSQPPSSLAPQGARVPFTRIQLAAPFDIYINSITVERRGYASDQVFDSISLLDESNIQIGSSRTLNSNHQAIFNETFRIPGGTTKIITVAGNMAANLSSYAGQMPSLAVTSVSASGIPVSGTLPIEGNQMTVNASFQVGSTQVRVGSYGTYSTNREAGTDQYPFSSFYVTAGSSDDIRLESVRWYQSGSASASDLSNVMIVIDGISYPAMLSSDGRHYTSTFGGGLYMTRGTTKEVVLRADIESGSSRTIKFDIESAADIRVTSSQYTFGIVPTASSVSTPSASTAEFTSGFPFFDGAQVTISGSSFTISRASSFSSQHVGVGSSNQPFAGFRFSSSGETVIAQRMTFDIRIDRASGSSANVDDIRLISLVDQYGYIVAGPYDASGSGTTGSVTFSQSVTIQKGERDYFLKGTLGNDFREGDRVTVSLEPGSDIGQVRGESSGIYTTAGPSGTVESQSVTVQGVDLNVSIGSTPVSQTIVAGVQDFTFATFVFDTTSSGEDVRMQVMPIRFTTSGTPQSVNGCQFFDGSFVLNTGSNVVNPSITSGDILFYFDSGFVLSKGTIKTLSLRCDVSGSAQPGATYRFGIQTVPSATGVQSGVSLSADITADLGPTMTIAGAGGFSVTLSPSSPPYKIAVAGSTEIASVVKLSATSEAIRLTQIRLQLSGASTESLSSDVSELTLWDGSIMVGRGIFTGINRTVTIPLTSTFIIPQNTEKDLTVRVLLAGIGINEVGTEGALVRIDYDGGAPAETKGYGESSGTLVTSSSVVDTNAAGIRLLNTVPTFAKISVPSTTLVNGEQGVLRFSVSADSASSAGLYKFTLRVSESAVDLSSVNVYAFSDSGFATPLSAASSDGRLMISSVSPDANGTIEVIVQNSSGSSNPLQIPAGFTRYFEVRGIITGSGSGSSLSTTLEGDSAYQITGSLMGTASGIDGDSNDDFIWSPNARGASLITDSDWTNGFGVPGLPSPGISQILTR